MRGGTDYTRPGEQLRPAVRGRPARVHPAEGTLQCPVAGHCIDHPGTIDLSAVLGSGTSNLACPRTATSWPPANSGQSEWWNVDVVGVKSLSGWYKIVTRRATRSCSTCSGTTPVQRDRKHHHQPVPVLLRPPLVALSPGTVRRRAWPLAAPCHLTTQPNRRPPIEQPIPPQPTIRPWPSRASSAAPSARLSRGRAAGGPRPGSPRWPRARSSWPGAFLPWVEAFAGLVQVPGVRGSNG